MTTTLARGVLAGLALFGLLSLFDVVFTFVPVGAGDVGPPFVVLVAGFVLGLASLVLIALALRGNRAAFCWLVGLRVLSALLAAPAFFADGVPGWAVTVSAVFIVLTLAGCALVVPALRRRGARPR